VAYENKPVEFVSAKEEDQVSRKLLAWLNTFPGIPMSIDLINYEFMSAGMAGMAMSLIQGTYIVERFISGAYIAEYQFKVIYRAKPNSPDKRLNADELLDRLGDWASSQKPDIGEGLEVQEIEQATRASLFARMEDGWEDHQIFMRMTYKVTPRK